MCGGDAMKNYIKVKVKFICGGDANHIKFKVGPCVVETL